MQKYFSLCKESWSLHGNFPQSFMKDVKLWRLPSSNCILANSPWIGGTVPLFSHLSLAGRAPGFALRLQHHSMMTENVTTSTQPCHVEVCWTESGNLHMNVAIFTYEYNVYANIASIICKLRIYLYDPFPHAVHFLNVAQGMYTASSRIGSPAFHSHH